MTSLVRYIQNIGDESEIGEVSHAGDSVRGSVDRQHQAVVVLNIVVNI